MFLTGAERGFLILRESSDELKIRVARNIDQENISERCLEDQQLHC